jgi:hypothetical protein
LAKLNEKLDKKQSKLIEKFLISSSFCTHTTVAQLYESLKEFLTLNTLYNINLKDLAGLSIGSIVQAASNKQQHSIVNSFYNLIKSELQNCKSDDCKEFYINSLANSLLNQSIAEVFEPEIENCKTKNKICVLCLKSMRKFASDRKLSRKLSDNLLKIFQTSEEDTVLRIEALNLLLHNDEIRNNDEIITSILLTVYSASEFEFTLYAHKLMMKLIRTSETFR